MYQNAEFIERTKVELGAATAAGVVDKIRAAVNGRYAGTDNTESDLDRPLPNPSGRYPQAGTGRNDRF